MDEGQAMTCSCKVDQGRFDKEAMAAFEQPVEDYQGGFVSMRHVTPPLACKQCLERINARLGLQYTQMPQDILSRFEGRL